MKKAIIFAFAFLFCAIICTTNVSAATLEGYPDFPTVEGQYNEYFIIKSGTTKYLYHLSSTSEMSFEYHDVKIHVNSPNAKFSLTAYNLSNNKWYVFNDTMQFSQGKTTININTNFSDWVYSSKDIIRTSDGSVVFQGPLAPEEPLEKMLKTEIPKMATKVIAAMKTILLCGVGCLALLVALATLSKIFYIFQVK